MSPGLGLRGFGGLNSPLCVEFTNVDRGKSMKILLLQKTIVSCRKKYLSKVPRSQEWLRAAEAARGGGAEEACRARR